MKRTKAEEEGEEAEAEIGGGRCALQMGWDATAKGKHKD